MLSTKSRLETVTGITLLRTDPGCQSCSPANPRIAKLAFTGETATGRLIMQYAAQNLFPVTLELGGQVAEHLLQRRPRRG
jgi:hypothetical protein